MGIYKPVWSALLVWPDMRRIDVIFVPASNVPEFLIELSKAILPNESSDLTSYFTFFDQCSSLIRFCQMDGAIWLLCPYGQLCPALSVDLADKPSHSASFYNPDVIFASNVPCYLPFYRINDFWLAGLFPSGPHQP